MKITEVEAVEKNKRFNILALSGGGYRGLYTATVLNDLEIFAQETYGVKSIAECFDLISGTSIGGIIALALAFEIPMKDVVNLFEKHGAKIFTKKAWYKIGAKYKSETLKEVLEEWFGDAVIGDLKHPVTIPAIDYTAGRPVVFKTPHHESFIRDWKIKIIDVALATSAAPLFFKRHSIGRNEYVDGGLFANNPCLIGLHEAEIFYKENLEDIHILSIGTLSSRKTLNPKSNKSGGLLDWGDWNPTNAPVNIVDLTLSAQQMFMQQLVSHRIGDNIFYIDETLTMSAAKYVGLDETTEAARQVLCSNARQSSKIALGKNQVRDFLKQKSRIPTWHAGPQKIR